MSDTTKTPLTLEDLRKRRAEILALMDRYGASSASSSVSACHSSPQRPG